MNTCTVHFQNPTSPSFVFFNTCTFLTLSVYVSAFQSSLSDEQILVFDEVAKMTSLIAYIKSDVGPKLFLSVPKDQNFMFFTLSKGAFIKKNS